MLPVSSDMSGDSPVPRPLLHIPYAYIMAITGTLPIASLITIVTLGVYLHLEETTATHCRVENIVPSISAVVGGVTPERYIWRLGIAFYSFPRLFDSFLYYNFLNHGPSRHSLFHRLGNRLVLLLHWVQNLSLFGLSYISSKENYLIHRNCFIGFISSSIIHMLLFLVMFKVSRRPPTYRDKISFRLRLAFCVSHIFIFIASIYLYWRHNTWCEPYMYSWYAMCEYLVVLTNVAFHFVQSVDLQNDYYISVAPPARLKHK